MLYKVVLFSAIQWCESAIRYIFVCVCVCVYTGESSGRETELPSDHNKRQKTFLPLLFFTSVTIWAQRKLSKPQMSLACNDLT